MTTNRFARRLFNELALNIVEDMYLSRQLAHELPSVTAKQGKKQWTFSPSLSRG